MANYSVHVCPKCDGFTERLTFATPAEYVEFVRQLVQAVNADRFLVKRAACPLEALLLPPPWPAGDDIAHDLECIGCGRGFQLYANVWNGRNWWEPQLVDMPDPTPLSVFKTGAITVMAAHVMKMKLEELVANGLVDELPLPQSLASSRQGTERWFRDTVSNVTYRLIEYFGFMDADDMRWEVVPPAEQAGRIQ